jgi:hypothetical protein
MPIEPGDSWFSPKSLEGERAAGKARAVEHRLGEGPARVTEPSRTPNAVVGCRAVRLRVIRSVVERGTAQTDG